jgi:hypothetical protein
MAVNAVQTSDLKDLAAILIQSVEDCRREGVLPHLDSAVKLICYQIAFAGNGDSSFMSEYRDAYMQCLALSPTTDFLLKVPPDIELIQ